MIINKKLIFFCFFILFLILPLNVSAESITPSNSAVVLIDIWDESFLDEVVIEKLNPFIEQLKEKEVLIIFAPSEGEENKHLKQIYDYKVFGYGNIDEVLEQENIKNIFYVGYDTLLCVIDKPMGILNFVSRNKNFEHYLIEDMSISKTKEMKFVATNFLYHQDINIVNTSQINEIFNLELKTKETIYPENTINQIYFNKLNGNKSLIILFKENKNDFEVIESQLKEDVLILEYFNDNLYYNNKTFENQYHFIDFIKKNEVTDIIYGGGYVNTNIFFNELGIGIANLYIKERYFNINLPKRHILDELFYIKEDLNKNITKKILINHYRDVGLVKLDILLNQKQETILNVLGLNRSGFSFRNIKNYLYYNLDILKNFIYFSVLIHLFSASLIIFLLYRRGNKKWKRKKK